MRVLVLAFFVLISSGLASAQTASGQQVTSAFAILTSSFDSKTAVAGQEITFKTIADVVVKGTVIIPRGSTVLAHVSDVRAKGKDQDPSAVAIVIEKAKRDDGIDVELQAIIAAVAPPRDMPTGASPVATSDLKDAVQEELLNEKSSGAIGYDGLALSWGLATLPPFTIFVTKNKSFKLSERSQVLLRMAPPRLPK